MGVKQRGASLPQDDVVQAGAVAAKRARKELRRAARRAARDAADFRAALEELRSLSTDSVREIVDSLESNAVAVRSDLQLTLDEFASHRRAADEVAVGFTEWARDCGVGLAATRARGDELERQYRAATSRIEAVETEVARRAVRAEQSLAHHLERLRVTAAGDVEKLRADELARVERAVTEIEIQARAVLNRSTDRIGSLLATAETQVLDAMAAATDAFEPRTDPTQPWPPMDADRGVDPGGAVDDAGTDGPGEDEAEREFFERLNSEFHGIPWSPERVEPFPATPSPPVDTGADTLVWSAPTEPDQELDQSPAREPEGVSDERTGPEPGGPEPGVVYTPSPTRNGRIVVPEAGEASVGTAAVESGIATVNATVITPVDVLLDAARSLAGRDVTYVRLDLSRRVQGAESRPVVRLCARDREDWWHVRDVPARTRATGLEPLVVALSDLVDVLDALAELDEVVETELTFDSVLTVEGRVLDRHDPRLVAEAPYGGEPIERVDLDAEARGGVVLDTGGGRVAIPPHLAGYLRARGLLDVEVADHGGTLVVTARAPEASGRLGVLCIAALQAADRDALSDRRAGGSNEAAQLIAALSTETTPQELERILKVGVGYVRRRAAAHPMLPPAVRTEIIASGSDVMRAAAATNPSIGGDECRLAAADVSVEVRAALAANAALPGDVLERLADDPAPHVRASITSNRSAGPDILAGLAGDEDPAVRLGVARRTDANLESLRALANDADQLVCAAVAANRACPPDVLEDLVSIAPSEVLGNPSAPETMLAAASRLASPGLRAAVAGNPSTPAAILKKLARDGDADVLRAIADHAPVSKLRREAIRRLEASHQG